MIPQSLSRKQKLLGLFFLFIYLNSCSGHSNWQESHIYSQNKEYRSRRFIFQDPISKEMSLEIIAYHHLTKCYLNFLDNLPRSQERQISLTLKVEDQMFQGIAYCLKGEQKALLSDKLSDKLLELLKTRKQFTIFCNQNQLDVLSSDFIDLFEKKQNKISQFITSFF